MMNELFQLIDSRIKERDRSLKTVPCKVVKILENNMTEIELITDNSHYIVSNCSGSSLSIGETVQLFYNGMISQSSYIGAAPYFNTDIQLIEVSAQTGILDGESETEIAQINLTAIKDTFVTINFNGNIDGIEKGVIKFTVYVDDIICAYQPMINVDIDSHTHICFAIPYFLSSGEHIVKIYGFGLGNINNICSFVSGQYIVKNVTIPYEIVTENDFIFETNSDTSNVVYYKGKSHLPKIPSILNGQPTNILCDSSFFGSEVKAVYIPDGVTEIE